MSKRKRPYSIKQPSLKKKPRGKEKPESTETETVVWRIGILDRDGEWGWGDVSKSALWDNILEKMSYFETMTWAQIKRKKKRHHSIPISGLCSKAQKRLYKIKQDDISDLFGLGLSGKERIWGIRDGRALKVLWWDPNHTVCPARKKHT